MRWNQPGYVGCSNEEGGFDGLKPRPVLPTGSRLLVLMTQQLEADELKLMAYANFGVGIKGSDTPSTPKPQLKTGQALPFWKASKLNGKSKPWKRAPRFPWGKRFTIQREIIQNTINWSEVPGPAIRLHPLVWKWGLSLHCTSDYKADESKAGLETPFSIHQKEAMEVQIRKPK